MKKPIYDFIDRQIILEYYKKYPLESWNNTPLVVTFFEITKAKKELCEELEKPFIATINYLDNFFRKLKLIK